MIIKTLYPPFISPIIMYDEELINSWKLYINNKYPNKKLSKNQNTRFLTTDYTPLPAFYNNPYYNNKLYNKSLKNNSITKEFIIKYCRTANKNIRITKDKYTITEQWNEFNKYLVRNDIKWFLVARYLCRYFKYKEFLKLPYWIITRNKVAFDKSFSCQLFNSHDNQHIVVHHNTYLFHGFEAHLHETLIVLCESCHHKHHKNVEVEFSSFKNSSFVYDYKNIVLSLNQPNQYSILNINNISNTGVTDTIFNNSVTNTDNHILMELELVDFKSDFHKAVYDSELIKLKSQKLLSLNKKVYKNYHS